MGGFLGNSFESPSVYLVSCSGTAACTNSACNAQPCGSGACAGICNSGTSGTGNK